jgi:hypothetical protein
MAISSVPDGEAPSQMFGGTIYAYVHVTNHFAYEIRETDRRE